GWGLATASPAGTNTPGPGHVGVGLVDCFVLARSDVGRGVVGLTRQTRVRRVALRPRALIGIPSTPAPGYVCGGHRGHADEGHAACPPLTWAFQRSWFLPSQASSSTRARRDALGKRILDLLSSAAELQAALAHDKAGQRKCEGQKQWPMSGAAIGFESKEGG